MQVMSKVILLYSIGFALARDAISAALLLGLAFAGKYSKVFALIVESTVAITQNVRSRVGLW